MGLRKRTCLKAAGNSEVPADKEETAAGTAENSRPQTSEDSRSPKGGRWAYPFQRLIQDMISVSSRPRRDATYWFIVIGSLLLAVVSDFLGVMRFLLSLNPEGAKSLGLDQIYEVGGLKSFRQGRYRFQYPATWLFDQSVAFSKQAEREVPTIRLKRAIIPDAAFGPPGGGLAPSSRAENLSVVVQRIECLGGLEDLLGEPGLAFEKVVAKTLGPAGSGRSIQVITASKRAAKTRFAYDFEYILSKVDEGSVLHSWSTILLGSPRDGAKVCTLYTMTIVAPEASLTDERRRLFQQCWKSFELE